MSGVRVMPCDVKAAGYCHQGLREWAKAHNFVIGRGFIDGVPVEDIRATGCPLGEKICQAAEARVAKEMSDVGQ